MTKNNNQDNMPDQKPPIFKTWNRLYVFVLVFQVVLVVLVTLFTKKYN